MRADVGDESFRIGDGSGGGSFGVGWNGVSVHVAFSDEGALALTMCREGENLRCWMEGAVVAACRCSLTRISMNSEELGIESETD